MQCFQWNIIIPDGTICFLFYTIVSAIFAASFLIFLFSESDKIATGSFDKTAKLWSAANGVCLQTYYGHTAEVVATELNPISCTLLATASMDNSARIFNIETGQETHCLSNHEAEVISVHFNKHGNILLTGSFDNNSYLWDLRSKE